VPLFTPPPSPFPLQKINAKNTWQLPLIDHMEKVIRGDVNKGEKKAAAPKPAAPPAVGGRTSRPPAPVAEAEAEDGDDALLLGSADAAMMNFQRASCTLDASVKIWSCRVDDVWTTSYRVLENLTRPGEGGGQDGAEGGGDGSGASSGSAENKDAPSRSRGKGASSSSSSSSNGASSTIEKSSSAITARRIEARYDVDPLFHKLSGGGAEEGAAGMLLNRLAVHSGCDIAFDSTEAPDVDGLAGSGYTAAAAAPSLLSEDETAALRATLLAALPAAMGAAAPAPAALAADPVRALHGALQSLALAPSLAVLYGSLRTYSLAVGDAATAALAGGASPLDALAAAASSTAAGGAKPRPSLGAASSGRMSLDANELRGTEMAASAAAAAAAGGGGAGVNIDGAGDAGAGGGGGGAWTAVAKLAASMDAALFVNASASAGAPPPVGSAAALASLPAAAAISAADLAAVDDALAGAAAAIGTTWGAADDAADDDGDAGGGADWGFTNDENNGGGEGGAAAGAGAGAGAGWAAAADGENAAAPPGAASAYAFVDVSALAGPGGAPRPGAGHWKFRTAALKVAAQAEAAAAKAAAAAGGAEGAAGQAEGAAGAAVPKKGAKGRKKAGAVAIDFGPGGAVPKEAFAKAKAGAPTAAATRLGVGRDAEQMTAAAVEKLERGNGGLHLLPPATGQTHDPLSLRPLGQPSLADAMAMFFRPQIRMGARVGAAAAAGVPAGAASEALFGVGGARAGAGAGAGAGAAAAATAYGGGGDDDDDIDDAGFSPDGGDYMGGGEPEQEQATVGGTGAEAAVSGAAASSSSSSSSSGPIELIAAGRQVEKIRVRYETVAKRVDVAALKTDMLSLLQPAPAKGGAGASSSSSSPAVLPLRLTTHKAVETEFRANARANERSFADTSGAGVLDDAKGDAAVAAHAAAVGKRGAGKDAGAGAGDSSSTFTDAIRALKDGMSSQVTVPFYFITLLHLANEHGLALNGRGDLSDFEIARLE
jgi:hypothetical protein